jgi:AmmeMemoRadiSam system protein A
MFEALSETSRNYVLSLARESIERKFYEKDFPRNPPEDPLLQKSCGAFVTLKKGGMLRGCIGRMESDRPMWETVAIMARAAAFEDPRFPAVTPAELDDLSIEISLLTPFEPLDDPLAVEVGKHGLLVEKGIHRGVLLPQVATDHGWTAEEFLDNVCVKASLPREAWKDPDVRLSVFSAVIIQE